MVDKKAEQEGDTHNVESGAPVIEASWAPKDPRDRLYDEDATAGERAVSTIRIIAAFHPVLNFILIVGEGLYRRPFLTFALIFVAITAGVYWGTM